MSRTTLIEIAATVLSLTGALLNALAHVEGFYVWLVANALWIWFAWRHRHRWQVVLWAVYWLTAAMGIVAWTVK